MKSCFLLILFIFSITFSQQKSLQTFNVKNPPKIDGIISNNEWAFPDSATNFIQMEPSKGLPSTERTVVYACFNEKQLYFAFKCFDKDPPSIVSNIQTRDVLSKNDDEILIILDSYADSRSAFCFLINPLAVQTDFRIADDGRRLDTNWDTIWQASARRTEWGWSAEIAIPFSSISYNSALTEWIVNFGRVIRSNSETAYWSGELNDDFRVSQGGLLTGLEFPEREKSLKITPYSTLRYENSDATENYKEWLGDAGLDVFYQITSGINSNLTINPDFATVEGDQEQINLTRWELSFPEKRLFFLEGNEHYSTRIKTFYSRRIGDINYGGKVNGKYSDVTFSLIGVRSAKNPLTGDLAANFSVMRLKKDVLKSSTVGLTVVDKSWDGGFTRSFSADYVLNLGKSWKLTGQWVGSAPGDLLTHSAWFVRFARESNIYHYHVRYSDTGKNFRDNVNQTGFIRDDDMREIDSDLEYKWWFNHSFLKYVSLESRNNIFWNHQGTLRSWFVTESARFYLNNRFSLDLSYNDEFKLYEKKFYNNRYGIELGYNTEEWAHTAVEYRWGKNFDSDFSLFTAGARFRPLHKLALTYSFRKLDFTPDPTSRSTNLNILSADYNFTRDMWIRLLAQNNTGENRIYFYGLFAWRFKPPFSAVYLIYTADERDILDIPGKEKNNIFFVKFSYQFGL
jgi:hypothetical protein